MSGSDEEGDYTLDIDHVTLEDDAMFQCQVGAAPGVTPVRSRYAQLTVTVKPSAPVISQGELLRTQEDRVISLECVSRGGKPAAEVSYGKGSLRNKKKLKIHIFSHSCMKLPNFLFFLINNPEKKFLS